jgi:hypothetical protein
MSLPYCQMLVGRALLFLVVVFMGCEKEWDQAAAFREQLRCGMTPDDVGDLARRLGAEDVGCPTPPAYGRAFCFVGHGKTTFALRFYDDKLIMAIRGRRFGLKGLTHSPEEMVCSDEELTRMAK